MGPGPENRLLRFGKRNPMKSVRVKFHPDSKGCWFVFHYWHIKKRTLQVFSLTAEGVCGTCRYQCVPVKPISITADNDALFFLHDARGGLLAFLLTFARHTAAVFVMKSATKKKLTCLHSRAHTHVHPHTYTCRWLNDAQLPAVWERLRWAMKWRTHTGSCGFPPIKLSFIFPVLSDLCVTYGPHTDHTPKI